MTMRHSAWCLALALALSSCFTGVESTPKITANDVKKQNALPTAEQRYMADVVAEPFAQWQPGKRFFITDDKISLIFTTVTGDADSLAGRYLVYDSTSSAPRVDGNMATDLAFAISGGAAATYRVNASPDELKERGSLEVPFTVDIDLIDKVRQRLQGQTYYVVTSLWYDQALHPVRGRKYVPVRVVDVTPGNHVYPVKLEVEEVGGDRFWLLMSIGTQRSATRNFETLFALADPHLRYPHITEATWQNIINGRVAEYMTGEECRLAIGSPKYVDRRPSSSGLVEVWQYDDGQYLMFEDGLLKRFRQ